MAHVLVTGGSRGIGAAVCRQLAAGGAAVSFTYAARADAADALCAGIGAAGGRALAVRAEASDPAALAAAFDAAEAAHGPLTGVVANAGTIGPVSPLAEMDPARIARIVDVNVTGALLTLREGARRMGRGRGGQGGAMVVVSSSAARLGAPGEFVDYAATKGATDTMTLGLAKELGPDGIRVNAVRPGLIETEIHAAANAPDRAARLGVAAPLGRAGTAEEVAETICWLLSDASSYVSGALLDVSGGR
ncbi:MAG: SDR family oxidoreductase [Pseudomonadota bacterium]